eukprot:10861444-Alexandrium_andersonii.AAC.1
MPEGCVQLHPAPHEASCARRSTLPLPSPSASRGCRVPSPPARETRAQFRLLLLEQNAMISLALGGGNCRVKLR